LDEKMVLELDTRLELDDLVLDLYTHKNPSNQSAYRSIIKLTLSVSRRQSDPPWCLPWESAIVDCWKSLGILPGTVAVTVGPDAVVVSSKVEVAVGPEAVNVCWRVVVSVGAAWVSVWVSGDWVVVRVEAGKVTFWL
jgi:hypothetical protein